MEEKQKMSFPMTFQQFASLEMTLFERALSTSFYNEIFLEFLLENE